ncbi:MAG TPA: FmdB family zinc ribbon protein [Verrucomicrobiales bacterium]|jgi:putative FmdB family regulatory protein|nr:FmdB family zinc ribbon protein [Verrucomicrobiales bacterium]
MPTYDYVCEKCGHEFEAFQSMNDPRLTKCPVKGCRGKVKRQIGTGAGFVFKGSGFYITDYRSEGYKAAAKSDAAASESKPSGDAKPAESKSATESKPAAEPAKAKKEKAAKGKG